jgi:hypothetical protein
MKVVDVPHLLLFAKLKQQLKVAAWFDLDYNSVELTHEHLKNDTQQASLFESGKRILHKHNFEAHATLILILYFPEIAVQLDLYLRFFYSTKKRLSIETNNHWRYSIRMKS